MANESTEYEAMVIPRGARIMAGESAEIALDVQGDLILQESQQGLTSLSSRHGSILIDDRVTVRSRSIRARHMIRVRGRLETDEIHADSISLEGGEMSCGEVSTRRCESRNSRLEVRQIKADQVSISGGSVEIGSIDAGFLKLADMVRGAILIAQAKERELDDSVQVKGGFESDVQLLGYLLKYRHQVLSDRVLNELKARKDGQEFQRFLLRDSAARAAAKPEIEFVEPEPAESATAEKWETVEAEPVMEPEPIIEPTPRPEPGQDLPEAVPRHVADKLVEFSSRLNEAMPDEESRPPVHKLIISTLEQADLYTLKTMLQRWARTLAEEAKQVSDQTRRLIEELTEFVERS